jgi:hypothetical protein
MDDQELLDYVEKAMFDAMLNGCFIEDHLGYNKYDPSTWRVGLTAGQVARLLDMAKGKCVMPVQERNFCPSCGKRTFDLTTVHTCTPPQENT